MSDPTYPLLPVLAFLSAFLVLIPLPWHLQAWNAGTCLYMIWTAIACFNTAINSVIWHNNAINWAPVWCDISTRIVVATSVAIPASSLCINRRLYRIAAAQSTSVSHDDKRKAVMEDLAIGLGLPIIQIPFHYIVNGHRFDILEDVGCWPETVNVWLTYPLVWLWPVVIGLVSATYCVLTLRAFLRRRAQFSEFAKSNSSLTMARYFRLMALASLELVCTTPIALFGMAMAIQGGVQPYRGWANVHWYYSRVGQYPAILWRSNKQAVIFLALPRYLYIVCAVMFFLFFGFSDEARRYYKEVIGLVMKVLRISPPADNSTIATFGTPTSVKQTFKHVQVICLPEKSMRRSNSYNSLHTSVHTSDSEKSLRKTDSCMTLHTLAYTPLSSQMRFSFEYHKDTFREDCINNV